MQLTYEDSIENVFQINPTEIVQTKLKVKPTLKEKKAARRARQLIGKNKGRWSLEEKRQYYVFLKIYSQFFVTKDHRRNDKVFRMMANFVKSRSPDQCRTHHQKLEFKYFKLSKIIETLKEQFGQINYEQIVKKCENASTNISTPTSLKQRDGVFDSANFKLFISEKEQGNENYEFTIKQPSMESPNRNEIANIDLNILDNGVLNYNDFLD